MSRVAKAPIEVPAGVDISLSGQHVTVKGKLGTLEHTIHEHVDVSREEGVLRFSPRTSGPGPMALAGTTRALVSNMIQGVTEGFLKKLDLVGVGYRAQVQGSNLNLALGFSHPISFPVPDGITIETPSQSEVVIKGIDRQKVGQTAATIRGYRPPEPYKGKGVKYSDETVVRKEAKKK